ncbi:RNA polymerase sigma factor [Agaribacterium sp. ZY112]|uniref:RNA polymerase sigma factor n=1 Tax=Agaribacterium sp. ZY112 TaxID=3233574 RepID=UPI0035253F69
MTKQLKPDYGSLITAARRGDSSAFTELVSLQQNKLRAFIAARTYLAHDVDDIAQESFVLAFNKLDELEDSASFSAWLCGIAHNLLRNHHRKQRRMEPSCPSRLEALIDEQEQELDERELESYHGTALRACLLKLSHEAQELIRMHYLQGWAVKELTEKLGVKHSTVTMRLHRARQWLKDCIKSAAEGEGGE